MPPWFIDIESATEIEAKSNGTPPASRTAAHASRANSPSSALHGVTGPSVEATPTKGLPRSASDSPSARKNARCGARSSPSTVIRDGSFFVLTHDFLDVPVLGKAEPGGALRAGRLGHRVHDGLYGRIRVEACFPRSPVLYRIPHLLRADRNAGEQHRAMGPELFTRNSRGANQGLHHLADGDARHPGIGPHGTDVIAAGERL